MQQRSRERCSHAKDGAISTIAISESPATESPSHPLRQQPCAAPAPCSSPVRDATSSLASAACGSFSAWEDGSSDAEAAFAEQRKAEWLRDLDGQREAKEQRLANAKQKQHEQQQQQKQQQHLQQLSQLSQQQQSQQSQQSQQQQAQYRARPPTTAPALAPAPSPAPTPEQRKAEWLRDLDEKRQAKEQRLAQKQSQQPAPATLLPVPTTGPCASAPALCDSFRASCDSSAEQRKAEWLRELDEKRQAKEQRLAAKKQQQQVLLHR